MKPVGFIKAGFIPNLSKVFHLSMKYDASSHNVISLLRPHPNTNTRMHAYTHTHISTSGFVQQTLQCQTQNEQK